MKLNTYPHEATVRVLEEENGGPIVGEILFEFAGGASRKRGKIQGWIHRQVEAENN